MSDLNFDFNNTEVTTFEKKFLDPGNYVVKVTEVKNGLSSQKQSPYIEVTVANEQGLTANNKYYLNTNPGPSGKSAMDITSAQLVILTAAVMGLDINSEEGKTKAKAAIGKVSNVDELTKKIASLTVGKPFAIRLVGKWVNPTDITKKSYIMAEFATGTFALPKDKLNMFKTFDPLKDVKGEPAGLPAASSTEGGVSNSGW